MLYNKIFCAQLTACSRDLSIIEEAYRKYNVSKWKCVKEAYRNPSKDKICMDDYWQSFCNKIGGKSYRIVTRSNSTFTCGFLCRDEHDDLCFIYIFCSRVIYAPIAYIRAAHN